MRGNNTRDTIQETKFTFANSSVPNVIHWLEHLCLPDRDYPDGCVSSVYLDTRNLYHYEQKRNGDLLKTKVRIRWYETGDAFLEIKNKNGSRRAKLRRSFVLEESAGRSVFESLPAEFEAELTGMGYRSVGPLEPVLLIRYRRRRFVDPASCARLSVDTDIEAPWANTAIMPVHAPVRLPQGVLEIKHLPVSRSGTGTALALVAPIATAMVAGGFSKYARCIEALIDPIQRRV
jgi:hypothetical protein